MRSYATFFVIAVMTLGLLFLVLTRSHTAHDAPAEVVVIEPKADGGPEAGVAEAGAALGDAAVSGDAGPARARPLRVTALGWELAAPGVALVMQAGEGAVAATIPALDLAPETDLDAIAARLARGGDAVDGADVAVLPAPAFVVAYEKLRALDPRAFLVTGFSHGREELRASPGALLRPPPATEDVKLVAVTPQASPEARAAGSESATVLGLYVLREIGVAPSRVRLLSPGTADARAASFAALVRGTNDERKAALSTADAARLVPVVLVAPRAALEAKEAVFRDLSRVWLEGVAKVAKDPGGIARAVADRTAMPLVDAGARPDALALVDRLGHLEAAALGDQGAAMLASEPGSLASTMGIVWSLAREGGLTTTATPDPLPIDTRVVKALGVAAPPAREPPPELAADAGAPTFAPAPASATPLFVVRDPGIPATTPKGKAPSATDLGTLATGAAPELVSLAALFPSAVLRVSSPTGEKNARVFAGAAQNAGVPVARLATTASVPPGTNLVAVEVLVAP